MTETMCWRCEKPIEEEDESVTEYMPHLGSYAAAHDYCADSDDETHGCAYCDQPLHEDEGVFCSASCAAASVDDGQHWRDDA